MTQRRASTVAGMLRAALMVATALSICLAIGSCCPGRERAAGEIKMGFVPSEDTEVINVNGRRLAELLTERTGIAVRPVISINYDTIITAMRTGDVQLAWLPPLAFTQAEDQQIASVLLKVVRRGNPWYYGAIIVHADSPYRTVEDLRGADMAWGDIKSFSGHVFPRYALIKRGIEPGAFFASERHFMNHVAVLVNVLNRQVDAGAVFSNSTTGDDGAWTQLLRDPEQQRQIRPIFYTDPIPGDTFAVSQSYFADNPRQTQALLNALLQIKDTPEGARILLNLYNIDDLVLATSSDYRVVREAAKRVLEEYK